MLELKFYRFDQLPFSGLCVCACVRVFVWVREVCCCFFFSFPTDSAVCFGISAVFVSAFAIVSPPASFVFPAFRTKAQPCAFTSCVQLSVFIYYAVWKPQKQWVTLDEGIWNSPLTYQPDQREQAWRFVSYMFVHAGWATRASADSSTSHCCQSHFSCSLRLLHWTNCYVIWVFWLNPLFFRTFRLLLVSESFTGVICVHLASLLPSLCFFVCFSTSL